MKTIITTLAISFISSFIYCQSSAVYDAGTILQVETGADICAENIIINGTWSGGGTECNGPLPVELISFTSSTSMQGRDVILIWKTDKEINNSGFEVERAVVRSQKLEFSKIGFREGKGTVNTPTNYSFEDTKLQSGKYKYRLKQIDYNGNFEYFDLSSDVEIGLPKKFNLSQNYPNPFNPVTKINFDLPFDSKVKMIIYDVTGREIKTLVNEVRTAGYHTIIFDGSMISSGAYFYKLESNGFSDIKKMMLIK